MIMITSLVSAEERLAILGLALPEPPTPFGAYVPAIQAGDLLFLSGMLATEGHAVTLAGVVGQDLDANTARLAARTAVLNGVALVRRQLGSLNRVQRVVRLGVYVAAMPNLTGHATIADAASEILRDLFGNDAVSTRLVFGVSSLPFGSPIELELIFQVRPWSGSTRESP
jgi:enamine deaminase RidA (YjgF/YER057c/UK114 family)